AYDELDQARAEGATKPDAPGSSATPIHDAEDRAQSIEAQRTELEVVWHMSRYVRRARVVRGPLAWPDQSLDRYQKRGPGGKYEGFQWVKW
ncbi:hypothetical protein LTR53_019235, partial [Teratosphaeriaceae sp. CCFEE 6253]